MTLFPYTTLFQSPSPPRTEIATPRARLCRDDSGVRRTNAIGKFFSHCRQESRITPTSVGVDASSTDSSWTGSAGIAYTLNKDSDHPTRLAVDAVVQSGLRASTGTVPNGIALPAYGVANLPVAQKVAAGTELRLDALNVADTVYQIRNGTGVGAGAPQFGLRRTILAGITQRF